MDIFDFSYKEFRIMFLEKFSELQKYMYKWN